ncbi:Lipoteichoic acid synthase 2 [compost metagenome]
MVKMLLFRYFVFHAIQADKLLADAASALAVLLLVQWLVPSKWKGAVFGTLNVIVALLLFASTLYFSYYGTVPTYTALQGLDQVLQTRDSVGSTIQAAYYLYFVDSAALLILYVISKTKGVTLLGRQRRGKRIFAALAAVLCLIVSGLYIRTGSAIANEVVQAESIGFLNYQVAAAMKAGKDGSLARNGRIEEVEAAVAELQASYPYQDQEGEAAAAAPEFFGSAQGMNVIVVQLEAFQRFPIHLKVDGVEITPVLNKLAGESFYFPYVFQQIGQGNTSDAEFMSNTSIYPTGAIAMSTGYGDKKLPSLPRILTGKGYESSTFHVNDVTFWDRNRMYPALGFDRYFDKQSFENDHFNTFGASDEEMYRVGLEQLSALQSEGKPFYAQFVTTSGHHPFKVPQELQRIEVPEQLKDTQLGDYLIAMNYSDAALGAFIEQLKASGIWENTMLVVYGDHAGLQVQDNDPLWVSEQLGIKYDERLSRFNIPLLIHVPGTEGKLVEQVGGQVDIMPTVSNLLGIALKGEGYTAFGQDLLNIDRNVIGMRYYLPTGSFFNNDILFVPGKGFEDGAAYLIRTLERVEDFSAYRSDYDYILKLMKLSDDYVRLLPKRAP